MDSSESGAEELEPHVVRTWLAQVLCCQLDDVPEFEVNEGTMGILGRLVAVHAETDQNVKDLTRDLNLKSTEYKAESLRYQSLVRKIGGDDSLSLRAQYLLDAMVSVALKLQLSDPNDATFVLALCHLMRDIQKMEKITTKQKSSISLLEYKTSELIHKSSRHQKILNLTAKNAVKMEMDVNKLSSKNSNLPKKIQEYGKMIEKLQMLQLDCGASPQFYHRAVMRCNEELKQLTRKLSDLQEKLETYYGLPSSVELTQEKIEAARQELMELEIDLAQKIEKSLA